MTEKRYIYADMGIRYEILDSWFGYTGDDEPTEREIEEYDYLVIGLASNQDAAEGICRRLNDQQDEINHLSNFGLHVILDKKNKEIEQLKQENEQLRKEKIDAEVKLYSANEKILMQMDYDEIIKQNAESEMEIINLKKENEQLKTENKKLNERIGILEGSLIDKGFDIND